MQTSNIRKFFETIISKQSIVLKQFFETIIVYPIISASYFVKKFTEHYFEMILSVNESNVKNITKN